jgi:hypothetical protein
MRIAATRDAQKIAESRLREQGYADGYARRAARSVLLTYQRSYRLGATAREAQDAAGDAA